MATFTTVEAPGQCAVLDDGPMSIFDLVEVLKSGGFYLAGRRDE